MCEDMLRLTRTEGKEKDQGMVDGETIRITREHRERLHWEKLKRFEEGMNRDSFLRALKEEASRRLTPFEVRDIALGDGGAA